MVFSAHLDDRAVIELDGKDTCEFLQGLISNDVGKLSADNSLYAALLTPQGKFLFDFILSLDGLKVLLDVERRDAAALLKRLMMYRLRSAVDISLREDLAVFASWGGDPAWPDGWSDTADPRLKALGRRAIAPLSEAGRLVCNASVNDYELHRIELGIPKSANELIANKSILLECRFEELNGVSFSKGCFVGQELTARTKHRGLIKKMIFPVWLNSDAEPGDPVMAGDREAGELRSVSGDKGLALLRLERVGEDMQLNGKPLRLREVPWLGRFPNA